ncbi:uncharacterized protein LOC116296957 [Actinia tenebrosa]|uniref:Uncharacterized protein LOC116296957 n=1 Tax=Actinia tenebrosa TaxID=6105 RepID=A0A6P8I089_ACTTE|nr:uncharacterized protein LOC116296957 [Actinia tenebrosa]
MSGNIKQPLLTLGSLIKKDLQDAYFLPAWPSSYSLQNKFYNNLKYCVFDNAPSSKIYTDFIFPCRNLPATGNEVPVLSDYQPPSFLKEHWKKWLPDFPDADIRPVSQGLRDDKPIVTNAAIQSLPKSKHCVDPDVLYRVQLKSSIHDIGVPCPKYFPSEDAISFPCMVKVDMSWSGYGNRVAYNGNEFAAIIKEIRDNGWTGNIIYQQFMEDVNEMVSFEFYLHVSGKMHWLGTNVGGFEGFKWTNGVVEWNKQEEYKNRFYDQFVVPVKDYLHKQGYFGVVMCEIMLCDYGMYLVDLNPRVSGDTHHLLLADYMMQFGFPDSIMKQGMKTNKSAKTLVEKANHINTGTSAGRVVIIAAADVEEDQCEYEISVFAQSRKEALELYNKM